LGKSLNFLIGSKELKLICYKLKKLRCSKKENLD